MTTGVAKTSFVYGVAKSDGQFYPAKWSRCSVGRKVNLAGTTLYATNALAKAAGTALNLTDENGNVPKAFR